LVPAFGWGQNQGLLMALVFKYSPADKEGIAAFCLFSLSVFGIFNFNLKMVK